MRLLRKRFTALSVVAAGALVLGACGTAEVDEQAGGATTEPGDGQEGDTDEADAGGDGQMTFATVVKLIGVAWFDRMEQGVSDFDAEHDDIDAFQQGPAQADSAQQVQVIQDLIAQGVDALGVVPFQPDAVEPVLQQAQDAGITVLTHEAPNAENVSYDIEAFRNDAYGVHLMDELASRMGEEGKYAVMVGSLTSATHNAWVDAAIAHQEETYPDMQQVGDKIETTDDTQTAYQKTQELLSAHPDLKGIQGSSAVDVVGAGQAIEEAGLSDDTAVVGTSVPSNVQELVPGGAVDLISFWDPAAAGYAMNAAARMLVEGETIETGTDLGVEGYNEVEVDGTVIYGNNAWIDVTEDNLDEFDF